MSLGTNLVFEEVAFFRSLVLPWHGLVFWQYDILFRDFILCSDIISQSDKGSCDYSCENLFQIQISLDHPRDGVEWKMYE